MTVKANGGVYILDVGARTILVGNSCGVGHLGGGGIVVYHRGNSIRLTVGKGDGESHSFVAFVVGVGRLLNRLGDLYNNG